MFVCLFVRSFKASGPWQPRSVSTVQHKRWEIFSFSRSLSLSLTHSPFFLFYLYFQFFNLTWHLIFCYNSFTTNWSLFSSFRAPAHTMHRFVLLFRRWLAFWSLCTVNFPTVADVLYMTNSVTAKICKIIFAWTNDVIYFATICYDGSQTNTNTSPFQKLKPDDLCAKNFSFNENSLWTAIATSLHMEIHSDLWDRLISI